MNECEVVRERTPEEIRHSIETAVPDPMVEHMLKKMELESREDQLLHEKPDDMTDEEWKREKRKIRGFRKDERLQQEADERLKDSSPFHQLRDRMYHIYCFCNAKEMREGKLCDTCMVVNEYKEQIDSMIQKIKSREHDYDD
jgi:hypothetical protein